MARWPPPPPPEPSPASLLPPVPAAVAPAHHEVEPAGAEGGAALFMLVLELVVFVPPRVGEAGGEGVPLAALAGVAGGAFEADGDEDEVCVVFSVCVAFSCLLSCSVHRFRILSCPVKSFDGYTFSRVSSATNQSRDGSRRQPNGDEETKRSACPFQTSNTERS